MVGVSVLQVGRQPPPDGVTSGQGVVLQHLLVAAQVLVETYKLEEKG